MKLFKIFFIDYEITVDVNDFNGFHRDLILIFFLIIENKVSKLDTTINHNKKVEK